MLAFDLGFVGLTAMIFLPEKEFVEDFPECPVRLDFLFSVGVAGKGFIPPSCQEGGIDKLVKAYPDL